MFVPGRPVPAGSKRPIAGKRKDGTTFARAIDSSGERGRTWRQDVQLAARTHVGEDFKPLEGPLEVRFVFTVKRPKNNYRTNGELKPSAPVFPISRPDVLKLARAVEDALTGIVWVDDSQIVDEKLEKRFGDPGCTVEIREIGGRMIPGQADLF